LATDMELRGERAVALASLGNLYWRRGEPRIALDDLKESLRLNQSDPISAAKVRLSLGTIDLGLGQPREALDNFQQALKALQQGEDYVWTSSALVSVGRANLMLDQPQEALASFEEALRIVDRARNPGPKPRATALQWIGVAQLQLHRVPQAIQSLNEALQIQIRVDRPGQALTEQKLGEAYAEQGDPAAAREAFRKALQITEEVEAPSSRPPILLDGARLERQQGHFPEALRLIEEAIQILESVRSDLRDDRLRTSFFASRRSYYDFYVELLLELDRQNPGQGYADRAFAASEKGRARSLLDLLAKGRSELTRGISPDLRQQEEEVEARLSQVRRDLVDAHADPQKARLTGSLEEQLKAFGGRQQEIEQRIKSESPHYAQIRYPSPLQREEIRELLRPDEALLEYSIGESGTYLFVVTTEGLAVHRLAAAPAQLSEEVEVVRSTLEKEGRLTTAFLRTAHHLYETLVAPAKPEIEAKRRLLIAPDGALYHLAFEALLDREANRESDCHFLIEDKAVSYVPSASVLSSLSVPLPTEGAAPHKRFIAFAPVYAQPARAEEPTRRADADAPSTLPELLGARNEVAAISRLYPETDLKVYLGAEASRENFQRLGLRTTALHFAGHGLFVEEHPEQSSLVFTDGFLQVDDIFNLELDADLVVLSACHTAGKVVAGEGLVGLTRAFLYAGAPSVIVTLWQAVDTSTPDLMVQFYGNLGRSGDKAEALRQAKLSIIERGRASGRLIRPYYWAPFILVGKPR
jgi:CHAT domain-containing protein/Tfp pilus assembly protein PilF